MKFLIKILLSLLMINGFISLTPAQSVLKQNEIPKDLVITLGEGGTIQFSTHLTYQITSDGKVFYQEYNGLPIQRPFGDLMLKGQKAPKKPKLKDRLSKNQLEKIIAEFGKSRFFEMKGIGINECTVNHVSSKFLSFSAGGKNKFVEFYQCGSDGNSEFKSFLVLYENTIKELNGVKKAKLMK